MHKLDEFIAHSGVKGMHWGVRHDEHAALNPKDPNAKPPGKIKKHVSSLKRERQWKSVIKDIDKLSTKDINTIKKRIDLENSLKKLSKSKLATPAERQAYLHRHDMSNDELQRKITRLQAKENLHESISKASKEQREFGIKVLQTAGSVGIKYATNKATGKKLGMGDAIDALTNTHPSLKTKQTAYDSGLKYVDTKATNPKVKAAIKLAQQVKFKTNDKK
jgi:hypothetical protein